MPTIADQFFRLFRLQRTRLHTLYHAALYTAGVFCGSKGVRTYFNVDTEQKSGTIRASRTAIENMYIMG